MKRFTKKISIILVMALCLTLSPKADMSAKKKVYLSKDRIVGDLGGTYTVTIKGVSKNKIKSVKIEQTSSMVKTIKTKDKNKFKVSIVNVPYDSIQHWTKLKIYVSARLGKKTKKYKFSLVVIAHLLNPDDEPTPDPETLPWYLRSEEDVSDCVNFPGGENGTTDGKKTKQFIKRLSKMIDRWLVSPEDSGVKIEDNEDGNGSYIEFKLPESAWGFINCCDDIVIVAQGMYPNLAFFDSGHVVDDYDGRLYSAKLMTSSEFSSSEIKDAIKKYCNIIDTIAGEANTLYTNDIDKILYIHNKVCLMANYDEEAARSEATRLSTATGMVFEGRGVCRSYAVLFNNIAVKCGIVSWPVVSETHAWNIVRLDGKWYHLDCTWDDEPSSEKGLNYNCFLYRPYDSHHSIRSFFCDKYYGFEGFGDDEKYEWLRKQLNEGTYTPNEAVGS